MKISLSDHTRSLMASLLNITVDLFLLAADSYNDGLSVSCKIPALGVCKYLVLKNRLLVSSVPLGHCCLSDAIMACSAVWVKDKARCCCQKCFPACGGEGRWRVVLAGCYIWLHCFCLVCIILKSRSDRL